MLLDKKVVLNIVNPSACTIFCYTLARKFTPLADVKTGYQALCAHLCGV